MFLALAVLCQVGRYWVISALGDQWNTRVIVVPGATSVRSGEGEHAYHPARLNGPYRASWSHVEVYALMSVVPTTDSESPQMG